MKAYIKKLGCLKSFSTFCRITLKTGSETVIIFMKETLSEVTTAVTGWVSNTVFTEVSLNDGIVFINGSVLNASSRVVGFASNVENY